MSSNKEGEGLSRVLSGPGVVESGLVCLALAEPESKEDGSVRPKLLSSSSFLASAASLSKSYSLRLASILICSVRAEPESVSSLRIKIGGRLGGSAGTVSLDSPCGLARGLAEQELLMGVDERGSLPDGCFTKDVTSELVVGGNGRGAVEVAGALRATGDFGRGASCLCEPVAR